MGGGRKKKQSSAAYLLNMAVRLIPMRRVLKDTGSIYLHCDPTESHYLKLIMDFIFGKQNFRNEIVWNYRRWPAKSRDFQRMHDIVFRYTKGEKWIWNQQYEPLAASTLKADGGKKILNVFDANGNRVRGKKTGEKSPGAPMRSVWDIGFISPTAKERLGYPTQKPLTLLERIIIASSNPDDLVLDPFCGCGTAVHAAEKLGRQWIGIDISTFATGLVRQRILDNFELLTTDDVIVRGVPINIADAEDLAQRDKFEFEKWVCGTIGAEGMFREPGVRGADGGVDGVLKFFTFVEGEEVNPKYAIVQVKGGHVTPDAVRALKTTVDHFGATAGIMVCFDKYMRTVENQRSRETFNDSLGTYPVIQGYSIEDLLNERPLKLPSFGHHPNLYGYRRTSGGRVSQLSL